MSRVGLVFKKFFVFPILFLVLFSSLILINALQLLSLVVKPFSNVWFRKINCYLAQTWWGACAFCLQKIQGVRVHISGDTVPIGENAILISNHQSMSDIPVLFVLAQRKKNLGNLKWVLKDVLKYAPGVGWGLLFLDSLFLKRNWHSDKQLIEESFKKFHENNIPIWLMSFPEGTRRTLIKQALSQQYAEKQKMTRPENVLVPRTKGFCASVTGLRKHVQAVYDVTIGYPDSVPSLLDLMMGTHPDVYLHVHRYPLNSFSPSDEEVSGWLVERFAEKDRRLQQFKLAGSFS